MRPRFSAANTELDTTATAALSRWTHPVGVSCHDVHRHPHKECHRT